MGKQLADQSYSVCIRNISFIQDFPVECYFMYLSLFPPTGDPTVTTETLTFSIFIPGSQTRINKISMQLWLVIEEALPELFCPILLGWGD